MEEAEADDVNPRTKDRDARNTQKAAFGCSWRLLLLWEQERPWPGTPERQATREVIAVCDHKRVAASQGAVCPDCQQVILLVGQGRTKPLKKVAIKSK